MKKTIKIITFAIFCTFLCLTLVSCSITNSEIANSMDNSMTRLAYSVNYLDNIDPTNYSFINGDNTNTSEEHTNTNITNASFTSENIVKNNTNNGDATASVLGGLKNNGRTLFGGNTIFTNTNKNNNATVSNVSYKLTDTSLLNDDTELINSYVNKITTLRGSLMLYSNDIRNGNIQLDKYEKEAIQEYLATIRDVANYVNSDSSKITKHLNNINSMKNLNESTAVINAKMIRINDMILTRYRKLDSAILAIEGILNIVEQKSNKNYSSINNTSTINNNETNTKQSNDDTSNAAIDNSSINKNDDNIVDNNNQTQSNNADNSYTNNNTINNDNITNNDITNDQIDPPNLNDNIQENNININQTSRKPEKITIVGEATFDSDYNSNIDNNSNNLHSNYDNLQKNNININQETDSQTRTVGSTNSNHLNSTNPNSTINSNNKSLSIKGNNKITFIKNLLNKIFFPKDKNPTIDLM